MLRGCWEYTGTAQLLASNSRIPHNTAQQLNPTSSWRFRCNLHFPPQRVLPPAFSQQLGRIEQGNCKQAVFARAGAAGAFRSGLTTAKSLSPKADEVLEDGFHAEEVILNPSRWIMCVCVCACTCFCTSVIQNRNNAQGCCFFFNQFLNSDFKINS